MDEDIYIASFVVSVPPDKVDAIQEQIEALPYAEAPMSDPSGKIVVVADAPSAKDLLECTNTLQNLAGALSVAPVYQHQENEAESKFNMYPVVDRKAG